LRERPEDIPVLAEFFAAKHSDAMGKKILGISAGALQKLSAYHYPGNIRELENEIRRMVALAKDGEYLTTQDISPNIVEAAVRTAERGPAMPEGATLKDKVENIEKRVVQDVLRRCRWNQSRAAKELGLSRVGLANKIKRYDLSESP
jgi:two-component system response regulator HupR/HoxA